MREDQKEKKKKKEIGDMIGRGGDGGLRHRKTGRDLFWEDRVFFLGEKITREKMREKHDQVKEGEEKRLGEK